MEQLQKQIYNATQDETYKKPIIDCREMRMRRTLSDDEVRYHHIHGYFEGTKVKFLFCFPEKENYKGHFIQHLSPFPGPDEENASLNNHDESDFISFALTHGSGFVESNMGSDAIFGQVTDSTIFYKSSAAVAEYARIVARQLYGEHRVYAYCFGGSGGGYKTMSCIENTNAFDGGIPFVIGSPVSLPNCLTVWSNGARHLRHCWEKIVDANEPGGGNMYEGLNEEEAAALKELINMGVPPRTICSFKNFDDGSLPVLAPTVHMLDPTYFTDFWTKPGYLGTAKNSSAVRDRIKLRTTVQKVGFPPSEKYSDMGEPSSTPEMLSSCADSTDADKIIDGRNGTDDAWQKMLSNLRDFYIETAEVPTVEDLYMHGIDIIFESGAAAGKKLTLNQIDGNKLIPGMSFGTDLTETLQLVRPGDKILIDNSDYLAIQTYHRHQVPKDRSFHSFDQYRDEDGHPIYPQRAEVISYGFTKGGCGSVQDGHIQGKVIIMNNLMDGDFPWQADWYRELIRKVNGDTFLENNVRLWYNDNAPHGDTVEMEDNLKYVPYLGMLAQALLDLSAWVEQGIAPVKTSGYQMIENQVILDEDPAVRGGVQPMVKLLANGKDTTRTDAEKPVEFTAVIRMGEGAGQFEKAEFSFEGEQDFPYEDGMVHCWKEGDISCAEVKISHVFQEAGTYFPTVRVISNRQPNDAYTKLENLCRARVIVDCV